MSSAACEQMRTELSAYLDGELSGKQWRQVDSHLHDCPACAAELAALRSVSQEVASLPRSVVPRDLAETVRREFVRESLTPASGPAGRARAWLTAIRVSASAALIVLAVTVTWRVARPDSDHSAAPALVREPAGSGFSPAIVQRENAVDPDDFALESEDARGLASGIKLRAVPLGAPVVALDLSGVKDGFAGGSSVDASAPTVDVVVAPQTGAAFTQTIEILQSAARAYASTVGAPSVGVPGRGRFAGVQPDYYQETAGSAGERVIDLTVGSQQVWQLIDALEDNASQQVNVVLNFRGSDSRLLQASLAGSVGERAHGAFSAVGEDDSLRDPESLVASDALANRSARPAEIDREEIEPAAPGMAGQGVGRRGDADRRKSVATRRRSAGAKVGDRSRSARELKNETLAARRPREAPRERGPVASGERGEAPSAKPAGALNAPTSQSRSRLGQLAEKMTDADFKKSPARPDANLNGRLSKRGAIAGKQAGGSVVQSPVRFRVRVAAPPVSATTRPGSSEPSRP